ncbi:MAG TPA: molybdopterin cofactor-binding domain-containing protein, partial [Burkholderiaceae bacterium]|nr:molybdopterin cofactor-binding domain-containing protein [Burkholderiaceae bacterium]
MTEIISTSPAPSSRRRRVFLIGAGVVAGALAIGVYRFYRPRDRLSPPAALHPGTSDTILTAWIRLGADGLVTVQVPRQEMGQGVASTLALIVAEEMDADPARLRFEEAPVDATYANATVLGDGVPFRPDDSGTLARLVRVTQFRMGEALGVQATGGSTSVRDAWGPMRQAGATARAMLLQAAATRFGVASDTLSVANGVVEHK